MTNHDEKTRIATLTSGAIRASGEKMAAEIMATIEAAEESAKRVREDGEQLIDALQTHVNAFADRVNGFVTDCHAAVDTFKDHQTRIVDGVTADDRPEPPRAATKPRELPVMISDKDLKAVG